MPRPSDEPRPPALDRPRLRSLRPPAAEGLTDGDLDGYTLSGLDLSGVDLAGAGVVECRFTHCTLTGMRLRGARLADVEVGDSEAVELLAARSTWRSVLVAGCRLGSVELYESGWRSVPSTTPRSTTSTPGPRGGATSRSAGAGSANSTSAARPSKP